MLLAPTERIDSRTSSSLWTKYSALLDVVLRLGDLGIGALAARFDHPCPSGCA